MQNLQNRPPPPPTHPRCDFIHGEMSDMGLIAGMGGASKREEWGGGGGRGAGAVRFSPHLLGMLKEGGRAHQVLR